MTVTTLASLFRGDKQFFDGSLGFQRLEIADSRWDWEGDKHSVLKLNMQSVARRRGFRDNLLDALTRLADQHQVGRSRNHQ